MNPKNILVAIEERNKWVGRRKRLVSELKRTQAEKKEIIAELSVIKKEISKLDDALADLAFKGTVTHSSIDMSSIK